MRLLHLSKLSDLSGMVHYKVCINKDHTIHPWNVVQYAKSIYNYGKL